MTQIKNLMGHLMTLILLIDPKEIIKPRGSAISRVKEKILNVVQSPSNRLNVTVMKIDMLCTR